MHKMIAASTLNSKRVESLGSIEWGRPVPVCFAAVFMIFRMVL
jgi:hypothetical protein